MSSNSLMRKWAISVLTSLAAIAVYAVVSFGNAMLESRSDFDLPLCEWGRTLDTLTPVYVPMDQMEVQLSSISSRVACWDTESILFAYAKITSGVWIGSSSELVIQVLESMRADGISLDAPLWISAAKAQLRLENPRQALACCESARSCLKGGPAFDWTRITDQSLDDLEDCFLRAKAALRGTK